MIATLLLLNAQNAPLKVANFFPLTEGLTLAYENRSGKETWTSIDVIGAPEKVGEEMASPIITRVAGREVERAYFRVSDDTVLMVAFDPKAPLKDPFPMLQVSDKKIDWGFLGETTMLGEKIDQQSKAWSRPGRSRTMAGRSFRTVEVEIVDVVGAASGVPISTTYTGVYGEGIGLVEMKSVEVIGKKRTERVRRLVSIRQAEKK